MTQNYFVEPYDVLFFRGNKSFHFGEYYTEGVFPPYPSTFQGFVRNKILRDAGCDDNPKGAGKDWGKVEQIVGNDATMPFEIYGPFLMTANNAGGIFVKSPLDLYRDKKDQPVCASLFSASAADTLQSDRPYSFRCLAMKKDKLDKLQPPEFMNLDRLNEYRLGKKMSLTEELPFTTEERVVIGLDDNAVAEGRRAVKETRFCVTAYNRLRKNTGLYFSLKADSEKEPTIRDGALRIGAETHPVYVSKLDENILDGKMKESRKALREQIYATKQLRVVLLQPGVFDSGWLPFPMTQDNGVLVGEVDRIKLQLLFAFTGAPLRISGYSFAKNKNATDQEGTTGVTLRPMIKAVPAGAVYCFSILNDPAKDDVKQFVNKYDNKKIDNKPYSLMGFNHIILAAIGS